jgi:ankyrin repeat protein
VSLDLKAKTNGLTALIVATKNNNVTFCKRLVENGSFVSSKDSRGKTPLHYAIEANNMEIIRLLVDYGASI